MIISVASGKGGTGKTTVATNLALSLGEVQFFDCDIEQPNSNIFLKATMKERKEVSVQIPIIDKEKCTVCGSCLKFCAFNAISKQSSQIQVFPDRCHSCQGCKIVCPVDAISWSSRPIGKIEHGFTKTIDFYQGILNIGEAMTTPVLRELKKNIDPEKTVILDAPPGTASPVIETVYDSDYCILVTEPTPFGLHDLQASFYLLRKLYIPFGVIINREGIGDKKIEFFCQQQKIPVIMKIPNNKEIAHLYSQGIPFIENMPNWREKFIDLYNFITEKVKPLSK
ncbi:MAG: ATP-binding protein [Thermoplasmatota archaeon]